MLAATIATSSQSHAPVVPAADLLQTPDARLRVNLVGSQLVGLFVARYMLSVEPLASMPAADLAAAIAPTVRRYLAGRLERQPSD